MCCLCWWLLLLLPLLLLPPPPLLVVVLLLVLLVLLLLDKSARLCPFAYVCLANADRRMARRALAHAQPRKCFAFTARWRR